MKKKLNQWVDDVNWEIAMFLKYGADKDGVFATLIVPAAVAFFTATLTVVWLH